MLFRQSPFPLICKVASAAALIAALAACGNPTTTSIPIVVTFEQGLSPPASIPTGVYAEIAATVANDPDNAGVTFSCVPDNPAGTCGTFTPTGPTGSNVAVCYLAPDQIPDDNPVTVTATSVSDPTKSVSAQVTIISGGPIPCP